LLAAAAELAFPKMKLPPVAPNAIEATPNKRASTRASPNIMEAVLPTHATFLAAVLSISSLLLVLEKGREP
jgi:hypothetical protein